MNLAKFDSNAIESESEGQKVREKNINNTHTYREKVCR